ERGEVNAIAVQHRSWFDLPGEAAYPPHLFAGSHIVTGKAVRACDDYLAPSALRLVKDRRCVSALRVRTRGAPEYASRAFIDSQQERVDVGIAIHQQRVTGED